MTPPRRARRRGPSIKQQIGRLKSSLHGHSNHLRHKAPPYVNNRPFNTLTVAARYTGVVGQFTIYTVNFLATQILAQLGLSTQDKALLTFRLHRVDVFAVATGGDQTVPRVEMQPNSLIPTVGNPATPTPGLSETSYPILMDLVDRGNLQECASVSYTWPKHMTDMVLTNESNFSLFKILTNTDDTWVHFHVHWATTDVGAPTAFALPMSAGKSGIDEEPGEELDNEDTISTSDDE